VPSCLITQRSRVQIPPPLRVSPGQRPDRQERSGLLIFMAAWRQQNLTVLAGHHRQRTAWSGTAGGMPDGRWADPPHAPAATASGASARQQGFATAPLGVSNLATVTFSGWCCRSGERCRQPRRVARWQPAPTSNSLRSGRPHDSGPDARSILEAGHSSQHMTTRCGAG
jgi:hypothetical protein